MQKDRLSGYSSDSYKATSSIATFIGIPAGSGSKESTLLPELLLSISFPIDYIFDLCKTGIIYPFG